jgi:hypothetical protein
MPPIKGKSLREALIPAAAIARIAVIGIFARRITGK